MGINSMKERKITPKEKRRLLKRRNTGEGRAHKPSIFYSFWGPMLSLRTQECIGKKNRENGGLTSLPFPFQMGPNGRVSPKVLRALQQDFFVFLSCFSSFILI